MDISTKTGKIIGVGLGPGNPDLMSVRADRLIRNARYIAFFRKAGKLGQARKIVEGMLGSDVVEYAMEYPVTTEVHFSDPHYNQILSRFYENCAKHLSELAAKGNDVIVLCEGDPFFYGSFMHIYTRLQPLKNIITQVVPAITGMSAAWSATLSPITWGDDVLCVLMATLAKDKLYKGIQNADAVVIMKIGRNLPKVYEVLKAAGKLERAFLVEYASCEQEKVIALKTLNSNDISTRKTPYFSIIILHGQGRRP